MSNPGREAEQLERQIEDFGRRVSDESWSETVSREYRRLEQALMELDERSDSETRGRHLPRLRRKLDELSEFGRSSGTY